jgi:hypothetical protein
MSVCSGTVNFKQSIYDFIAYRYKGSCPCHEDEGGSVGNQELSLGRPVRHYTDWATHLYLKEYYVGGEDTSVIIRRYVRFVMWVLVLH